MLSEEPLVLLPEMRMTPFFSKQELSSSPRENGGFCLNAGPLEKEFLGGPDSSHGTSLILREILILSD